MEQSTNPPMFEELTKKVNDLVAKHDALKISRNTDDEKKYKEDIITEQKNIIAVIHRYLKLKGSADSKEYIPYLYSLLIKTDELNIDLDFSQDVSPLSNSQTGGKSKSKGSKKKGSKSKSKGSKKKGSKSKSKGSKKKGSKSKSKGSKKKVSKDISY